MDQSVARLLGLGPSAVVVTRGRDGATWFHAGGRIDAPATEVEVADTIGAGDTFGAAMLDALWDLDMLGGRIATLDDSTIESVLRRAAAAAASRSHVPAPTRRTATSCSDGRSAAVGEERVELGVALVDAGLHAAAQPGVAVLEAVAQRLGVEAGAAVAEVLEGERLEGDAVGHPLPGEGLHDAVGPHGVEAAAERLHVAVAVGDSATRRRRGRPTPGSSTLRSAGPIHCRTGRGRCGRGTAARAWRRSRGDVDDRHGGVRLDGGLGVATYGCRWS